MYEQFEIVQVTPAIIRAGLDFNQTRSVAFYDALIIASAQAAGCKLLFSEDRNTGEIIAGVHLLDPFVLKV
jgi:predicted nucleic acid-binding protein